MKRCVKHFSVSKWKRIRKAHRFLEWVIVRVSILSNQFITADFKNSLWEVIPHENFIAKINQLFRQIGKLAFQLLEKKGKTSISNFFQNRLPIILSQLLKCLESFLV